MFIVCQNAFSHFVNKVLLLLLLLPLDTLSNDKAGWMAHYFARTDCLPSGLYILLLFFYFQRSPLKTII